jgi:hypothetical protein
VYPLNELRGYTDPLALPRFSKREAAGSSPAGAARFQHHGFERSAKTLQAADVLEALAVVLSALPEHDRAPIADGVRWGVQNPDKAPPSREELCRRYGNMDRALLFLRAVESVRSSLVGGSA